MAWEIFNRVSNALSRYLVPVFLSNSLLSLKGRCGHDSSPNRGELPPSPVVLPSPERVAQWGRCLTFGALIEAGGCAVLGAVSGLPVLARGNTASA